MAEAELLPPASLEAKCVGEENSWESPCGRLAARR
jgi:hypothetical protein